MTIQQAAAWVRHGPGVHPVHPTALLAGVEHLAGGGAQTLVIVGDDQLHPAQAAIRQRAQEGCPEGLRLRRPGGNVQHFAAAIGVDADGDCRCRRDDPPALAHLEVCGVDP